MDKADLKAKESILKDLDRIWEKYQHKVMKSPGNSWRFQAFIKVKQEIVCLKSEIKEFNPELL